MKILIYTTPGCSYCETVKELMRRGELKYTHRIIDKDVKKEKFSNKYPNASGFPYVIIDGKEIGGLQQTAEYLVKVKGMGKQLRRK